MCLVKEDHPAVTPPLSHPPTWVYKRDGRLVPFEADKISRALFAATESLGRPDAFLARELTDGVVHFLAAELDGVIPTTAQVRDLVIKVVRELGQPALAEAFASHVRPSAAAREAARGSETAPENVLLVPLVDPPAAFLRVCLREYTLRRVFARDLVAAQRDGLLTLTGLEAPLELAGCVLGQPRTGDGLAEAVIQARRFASRFVALDGPEYALAQSSRPGDAAVADHVRGLMLGLRAAGLSAVVNLNCATPPPWAGDLAEGPLFAGQKQAPAPAELAVGADALLEALRQADPAKGRVRIDWHLAERDFLPEGEARLLRVARLAAEGDGLAFTFDRPRRPVLLAEGVDRRHPAVLLTVGLHLPQLAAQPGVAGDTARFLHKLGSLARLALSAAVQKRDFLRRHGEDRPDVMRGFLLQRARLVAAPVGLEAVARLFTGRGLCEGKPAVDFTRQTVQRLREVLRQDGRACLLETCLDAPPLHFRLDPANPDSIEDVAPGQEGSAVGEQNFPAEQAANLGAWDTVAEVKAQLRAAGALHAAAETGTAAVFLPTEPTAEQVADWLRWAWQHTDIARLRFLRLAPAPQQLTLKIGEGNG
ncbi:MAG TPA: ATP cone domain-containing protein [Gemmataceae bacterium]|nr:ATP cone domain-containing protein [Gemmataceae bacterium]